MAESQIVGNALAIVGAVVDVPKIVTTIASGVQNISEQRRSGGKNYEELQANAHTLRFMIQGFQTAQSGLRREELEQLISKIENCLARFPTQNLLDHAVEGMFTKEYRQLQEEYRRLEERFMLVSVDDVRNSLNQAVPLWTKVLETTKQVVSMHSPVNLVLETSSITWEGSVGRGQVAGYGDVECRRLDDSTASRRALQLYQDLQRGAHVQTIHGIAEINKENYVIMQDCSGLKMLQSWRNDGNRELTLTDRAYIAFDVAQSVTWLHEGGLIVKFLTDNSIRLTNCQNCRQKPVLTGLQYARCLYEKTNSARTDSRYEAPEILKGLLGPQGQQQRQHSQKTDIWSLGIVIWQILTDGVPYQLEKEMKFLNPETVSTLRRCLESSSVPGAFPSDLPSPLVDIIQSCWSPIDHERPPAKAVTSSLYRAIALLDSPVVHSRPDRMDDRVGLMSFQQLNQARSAARELVQKRRDKKLSAQADKLSEDHLKVLLHHAEDPLHPECAFLVGATIWWEVVNVWSIKVCITPRALGFDGRRAELALSYLLVASDRGYTDANREISYAYATLYHDYDDRVDVVHNL